MKQVLFVCVQNSGRSQVAEALARAYGIMAVSAGTMPGEGVDPLVIKAMKERGIGLPGKPRSLTEDMVKEADLIVTMGCSVEETCPYIEDQKNYIEKVVGLPVKIGTHPMPRNYIDAHEEIGDWKRDGAAEWSLGITRNEKDADKYDSTNPNFLKKK